jgi:hypothetical protein
VSLSSRPARVTRGSLRRGTSQPVPDEAPQPAEVMYEELRVEYAARNAEGIPESARKRYEESLTALRLELRKRPHPRRIGQILLEMRAIDQEALARALGQQLEEGGSPLLGEVLLRYGRVDSSVLCCAARRQASDAVPTRLR